MDNFDNRPQTYGEIGILSTAGAVPVKNDKGEISMQKVKVQRYISGKRPEYATGWDQQSDEDSDGQDFISKRRGREKERMYKKESSSSSSDSSRSPSPARNREKAEDRAEQTIPADDPRLRRLLEARLREKEDQESDEDEEERRERLRRRRRVQEPEIVEEMKIEDEDEDNKDDIIKEESEDDDDDSDDSDSDDEMDEQAVQRRRDLMRQRAIAKAQMGVKQEELLAKEEEKEGSEEEEESSEEETDSEEEEQEARLKPVFVRAKDRLTIQEREREEMKARQAEREAQKLAEERRRASLRMVEAEVRKTQMAERKAAEGETVGFDEINTDDENDEVEYETWKVRELRRLKRDREEREAFVKELAELERFRNLTEDEKREEMKINPKQITNAATKGKYKFMQKYYHRGAFYLEDEENVLKRDVSHATLEDKFDKSILPKVMQVKNFGRSGRTKYTHLVDQVRLGYNIIDMSIYILNILIIGHNTIRCCLVSRHCHNFQILQRNGWRNKGHFRKTNKKEGQR